MLRDQQRVATDQQVSPKKTGRIDMAMERSVFFVAGVRIMARATKSLEATTSRRKPGRPPAGAKSSEQTRKSVAPSKRSTASDEVAKGRKPGRSAKAAVPAKPAGRPTPAAKGPARALAAPPAPKLSKDELRAQVEKLELVVARFRTKSREANRTAKTATARIAELEEQVAQLERAAKSQATPAMPTKAAAKPRQGKRQTRETEPGEAGQEDVAVQEPAPLDEEAEAASGNAEENPSQH